MRRTWKARVLVPSFKPAPSDPFATSSLLLPLLAFTLAQVSSGALALELPLGLEVIKEEVGSWSVC